MANDGADAPDRETVLPVPPECVAGVAANRALLADHRAIVRAALAELPPGEAP